MSKCTAYKVIKNRNDEDVNILRRIMDCRKLMACMRCEWFVCGSFNLWFASYRDRKGVGYYDKETIL